MELKWIRPKNVRIIIPIGVICLILISSLAIVLSTRKQTNGALYPKELSTITQPPTTLTPSPTPTLTPNATVTPSIPIKISPSKSGSKILFGIGSQAGPAMDFRLVKEAPVHMLTSWYNRPNDLEWMSVQKNDLIPRLYTKGYVVHLVTWTDLPEENIETPYGPACGRPYPVSAQVVEDMKQLAQIYNGNGPLYLSLFTEFQTFTCTDNNWIGNENYWQTLKDNFRKIKDAFHQYAPQSKVALSWGGWQSGYDDTVNKGGRSLFPYFADILKESDFADFQAMESDTNIQEMLAMTKILGAYGKPVMLSHYKPSSGSQDVFDNDMQKLFTDEVIQQLTSNGLFAFSFMDDENINNSEASYQVVKNGIQKYGR